MMFMNAYDVLDAREDFSDDPIYGPATATLYNLMDWTNRSSDGWAYWTTPLYAASNLMEFIQAEQKRRRDWNSEEPNEREVRAAYKKSLTAIKAFRTRQSAKFEIVEAS